MRQKRGGQKKSSGPGEGGVKELPFRRGRIACAKQSNMELLQLDRAGEEKEEEDVATLSARTRLAQLTEKDNSLKSYMKELRKVLEHADVLLEVLDVRDPLGCRAYSLEREAQRQGKRIVLILNKIDLVPASNARAWLEYLRHEYPTLPFKASTQQQRNNLGQGASVNFSHGNEAVAGGAEAAGTRAILQLIKNYSRNLNLKSSITVGTIGAPNVGKSSLINSLKRSRVCSVAATPGHTKVVQGIMLDRQVRLLDSPGIVFTDSNAPPGATAQEAAAAAEAAMLRNVLKVELVPDPIEPVQAILNRIEPKYLAEVYGIPALPSRDANDFLLRVAYQKGRLAKGAVPDIDATARSVLHDWNKGKIRYHTDPPAKAPVHISRPKTTVKPTEAPQADDAAVVSSFGEAFDLAGLLGEADAETLGGDGGYEPRPAPVKPEPVPMPEEAEEPADVTDSTLGKRGRDLDSDDDEDDDDFRRPAGNAFAALMPDDDDDDDEEDEPEPEPAPKPKAKKTKEAPMFTEAEREGMAVSRGAQRRKARKEKKRKAGLDVHMEALMDLEGEDRGLDQDLDERLEDAPSGALGETPESEEEL